MSEQIVIIGAGQAAAQAVTTLKAEGFGGSIVLVGDEAFPPYQRPPLSKAYLMGKLERERLFLKPDSFYPEAHCELLLGVSARAIDRKAKTVLLSDGSRKAYDKLLIATGTRVRKIKVPGAELPGVHYLRSVADVDLLSPAIVPGKTLAVVGGGYIGLEVAAVARKLGLNVVVFEALDRLMARAVSPQLSAFYEQAHRAEGVELLFKTGVEAFEGAGKVERVRAGGKVYPVDLVLVGIGAVPNVELAEEAGLTCDDGIVVDKFCTSVSDPMIFAAGDCTRHHGHNGEEIRLECVQNAIDQAKHAALAMMGKPTP
ncbi:MAG: FAD-dependent oxidoreductase, partial [Pseudomonadota bacterium]|nr:FAD-dependent oxidoreductase [Pseudomonadota bacterium]